MSINIGIEQWGSKIPAYSGALKKHTHKTKKHPTVLLYPADNAEIEAPIQYLLSQELSIPRNIKTIKPINSQSLAAVLNSEKDREDLINKIGQNKSLLEQIKPKMHGFSRISIIFYGIRNNITENEIQNALRETTAGINNP
ncbi:hypothetical protein AVEN_134786-1 [Araneus ventricosus]|uniref:Uncharacterized protein n=1 Tax=Araneus ventricosus TaxID=182803 RepID=A0A4Y2GBW2_ARAVE|nr:hypothetical protein AVEN_134786-1 [Araneus ventricosus]